MKNFSWMVRCGAVRWVGVERFTDVEAGDERRGPGSWDFIPLVRALASSTRSSNVSAIASPGIYLLVQAGSKAVSPLTYTHILSFLEPFFQTD